MKIRDRERKARSYAKKKAEAVRGVEAAAGVVGTTTTTGMGKTTMGTTPSPPPSTMTTSTGMTTTTTIGTTTMAPLLTTTTTIAPCSSSNGLQSNDLRLPSGVSELCHYPPLIHSCGSRGSSCCAVTVSTTHRLNCQPTSNDVSSSSKAWSHVYSQRKSNCSRRTRHSNQVNRWGCSNQGIRGGTQMKRTHSKP